MAGDSYTLEVSANVKRYAAEMATIPGITDKQAARAALAFQKRLLKAQDVAGAGAKVAAKKAGSAWESASKSLGASGELSEKLAGGLGLISGEASVAVSAVGKLGKTLSVIASPAGLAVAAVGAVGLAGVALGASLVQAAFSADDALKSLAGFKKLGSDFYPVVPKSTLDSIAALNASGAALGSIFDRLVVQVGGAMAPALERVANVAVGAALTFGDWFAQIQGGIKVLELCGRAIVAWIVQPLAGVVKYLDATAQSFMSLADLTGVVVPEAARASAAAFHDLSTRLDLASLGLVDQAVAGTALSGVLTSLDAKGAAFIQTQIRATKALSATKTTVYDLAGGLAALQELESAANAQRLSGYAKLRGAQQEQLDKLGEIFAKESETAVKQGADWATLERLNDSYQSARLAIVTDTERQIQELQKTTKEKEIAGLIEAQAVQAGKAQAVLAAQNTLTAAMEAAQRSQQQSIVGSFGDSMGAISSLAASAAESQSAATAKTAKRLFGFSKGAAIGQAVINGALAVTKSLAELGPIAGGVAAIGVGLTTAAQVATIAKQEPPSFATGGVIAGGGAGGMDHMMVQLTRSEAETGILNGRGTRAAGGPRGVSALNRGEGGGQVVVVQTYGTKLETLARRRGAKRDDPLTAAGRTTGWKVAHG